MHNASGFLSELGEQLSASSRHFIDLPQFEGRKPIIGVCAMDSKARSKPMTNILNRLQATARYSVVFFGEKTILDEDIENWPICDFLISFFSDGFPLDKALQYTRLRKPFSVNSLVRQFLLFDRRLVLEMLRHIGVPTPLHLVASRDGGPTVHPLLRRVVEQRMGFTLGEPTAQLAGARDIVEEIDEDTLRVGGKTIRKPFVEKPCDAEDHNIYVYYASHQGGGVRRLFRKIGNKSSEFHAGPQPVRRDGSYIYEEFIDVDNAVDVKVYTVGRDYAHAETRKSPVVDGHVRRNSDGKEMRFVTQLTREEREYAHLVSAAFGQRVCGFDLLRATGRSMVIDVNGWSFVKGNDRYYDDAASILDSRFQEAMRHRWFARFVDPDTVGRATYESRWVLKGVFNVCRHADRTPKQKIKLILAAAPVMSLLGGLRTEVVLRTLPELQRALNALWQARDESKDGDEPVPGLKHLIDVLERKIDMLGTKVQLKPQKKKGCKTVDQVQLVLKWGGECTHAGTEQSQDLAENMRRDLLLINPTLLDDVKLYSSTERRVLNTVSAYARVFFDGAEFSDKVEVRSDMLDDSTVAKDEMEVAKTQLRDFFNFDGPLTENPFYVREMRLPRDMGDHPREFLRVMCEIMHKLIERMERNFADLGQIPGAIDQLQMEWCCNETAELFRERWKKILCDFETVDKQSGLVVFDPAKVGELYDSLKYDALHNRCFLERIFMSPEKLAAERALPSDACALGESIDQYLEDVRPELSDGKQSLVGECKTDAEEEDDDFLEIASTPGHATPGNMSPPLATPKHIVETAACANTVDGESLLAKVAPSTEQPSDVALSNVADFGSSATALTDAMDLLHVSNAAPLDNNTGTRSPASSLARSNELSAPPPEYPPDPLFLQQEVRELYYKAKLLFDFVTRREYGIDAAQRKKIGIQASVPLLKQLISDLRDVRVGESARTRFYFTKESHIHTLLNLVFLCGMPTMIPYERVGELDYLTHIMFEVYERKPDVDADLGTEYSLRIGFSPGANCYHVLDMNVDSTHALKVLPRRNFTFHTPLDKAIDMLQALLDDEYAQAGNSGSE
ncbi:inositol hexakisphosphate and diphosphoinositol-pentakisphosphate kinase [Coemansia sp. S100]|nr:inositol hexakisphosphate and diphosphoinositol-pentakisphosphate kinase [Coemansia sp. S680]KAJ2073851.1 inositol hexakisphosphate and diphosphoinositol-pentakisphosphate kinase [Coemansia sp. S155-1]KAJ2083879.1 inositol hexakisphosphate and diphosphoinositol-pentakisphosphate kinase [Coemansia sp. S100]